MALRVQAIWTSVGLGESFTNLHFTGTGGSQASTAAAKVRTWLNAISGRISNTTTVRVSEEVIEFDHTTGLPIDVHPVIEDPVTGGGSAFPVPDVAQVLLRFSTGGFRGARRISGRSFLPRIDSTNVENGFVTANARASLQENTETYLLAGGDPPEFAIWSRPTAPLLATGLIFPVTSVSVWEEFAMLGGRRS